MRYQIYSANSAANDEIRSEFGDQYIIYDAVALEDITDENGVIGFDSESDAQQYIDEVLL